MNTKSDESVSIKKLCDIVLRLNTVISKNKAWLSEIDGAIGDGDHGINMAKGFALASEQVEAEANGFTEDLNVLSKVLMMRIGGSMGPLYGMFFKAISDASRDLEEVDLKAFLDFVESAFRKISTISKAKPGDKTLMDCLAPAVDALREAEASQTRFPVALQQMKVAAEKGRDATKDLVSKVGRSSRLGERSRGVLDAGACSCCLILCCFADQISEQL